MARGGHKTPPHTSTLVVTCIQSDTNVTLEASTTSTGNPDILVEPVTALPQVIYVQEIVRQTLIRTCSALSRIRQPGRQINQSLDFTNLQEQIQGNGLPKNPLGGNTTNPTKAPILGAGGSNIPPSPSGSSPSSSGGESLDEGSSSLEPYHPSTPPTPMENQNNTTSPWIDQDFVVVLGPQHPLYKNMEKWLPKFDPDLKQ
jgi:hypothetical protein